MSLFLGLNTDIVVCGNEILKFLCLSKCKLHWYVNVRNKTYYIFIFIGKKSFLLYSETPQRVHVFSHFKQ